jgi:hypothetical protein
MNIRQPQSSRYAIRFSKVIGIAVAFYLLVICSPIQFAIADIAQPGANNNGDSPYSMYERCHPQQFHIPTGLSC